MSRLVVSPRLQTFDRFEIVTVGMMIASVVSFLFAF